MAATAPQSPPRFLATPDSIARDAQRLIKSMRLTHDHVVASVTPATATFENVLLPWVHAENGLFAE